ncbi:hypothetical protein ACFV6E_23040 [Streptomyces sp. NPDC059785]|uniref:hypothetical protein n=1 Tax=Streptomyces sp. NPDC059785 TaxID=3346945 RepID=UPI00365E416C
MLTGRQGERLPDWLYAVRRDDLPSLHKLAAGIDRDRDAVIAGLTLSWKAGVVEGHVNRMLRRQMFGTAAGEIVGPRATHIDRLKAHVGELKDRVAERSIQFSELTEFKQYTLSRIAAQHREIERLRAQIGAGSKVTPLPR